ncbi:MAG: acyltransferase [Clostridia bacterium]|nr:acyltransferase [Clostridia bacterium]
MNSTTLSKQRYSGPEVLRILAMLMIIAGHLSTANSWSFTTGSLNTVALSVFAAGGQAGVVMIIMLTGFFGIKAGATHKKAFILIVETVFYSVLTYLVSCALGANMFRSKYIFFSLVPLITNRSSTWFITLYLLLYALIPLLNAGINRLTQRQHLMTILLFLFVWSVLPNTYEAFFPLQNHGYSFLWAFVLMYLIGAYLRTYPSRLNDRRMLTCGLLLLTAAALITGKIVTVFEIRTGSIWINRILRIILALCTDGSMRGPLVILFGVLCLTLFTNIRGQAPKILRLISGSIFGVYLLHESSWLNRRMWDDVFRITDHESSRFFVLYAILTVLIIFAVCSAVDILRKLLLEQPVINSKLFAKAAGRVKTLYDGATDKLHIGRGNNSGVPHE